MKTTPIPVKFDRQGHSCNFYEGFGPTAANKHLPKPSCHSCSLLSSCPCPWVGWVGLVGPLPCCHSWPKSSARLSPRVTPPASHQNPGQTPADPRPSRCHQKFGAEEANPQEDNSEKTEEAQGKARGVWQPFVQGKQGGKHPCSQPPCATLCVSALKCKLTWLVLGGDPAARSHRVEQLTAL